MNDATEMNVVTREKLLADFKVVIADAEELLRLTANQAGDKVAEIRARAQDHLSTARIKLAEAEVALMDRSKAVARATDDFVHENPWRSMGIAAGVGLIIGLLIGRR